MSHRAQWAIFLFFSLWISGALGANSCGATYCTYNSNIMASETWIDGNTYVLTGDVNVTGSGVTLTIQPGAVVKYDVNTELRVLNSARISANGTADKNILFLSCKDQNAYAGATNANTSAAGNCSGAPSGSDYTTAIWIASDSGMTTSDALSYLTIRDATTGIRLDESIGQIHHSVFTNLKSGYGILISVSSGIEISDNQFTSFVSGIVISIASTFSGKIYGNTFYRTNVSNTNEKTIELGSLSGSIFNNVFLDNNTLGVFVGSAGSGSIYNNLFSKYYGYGIQPASFDLFRGPIYNNTFVHFRSPSVAIYDLFNNYRGIVRRNVFAHVNQAILGMGSATASHNAYFNVSTSGGSASQHANDENSATGFTSDPFSGGNSDRNFLLNTTAAGGAQLVNAGGVDVNAFYAARTTQLSNALDRGTVDMGFHYDQNAPFVAVVRPSDSNVLAGTQTIDFNFESGFGATANLRAVLKYSATPSGGTQVVDANLNSASFSCSAGPVFVCSYAWNTAGAADGNYFVVLTGTDYNGSMVDASDNNFQISNDSTAPVTSVDYNAAWQNTDANVVLTCSDASGCSLTQYRLDASSGSSVSLGAWTTFDSNILIATDGNWGIDFNSSDTYGNRESTNRIYVLIDKSLPSLSLTITSLTVTGLSATFTYLGSATSGIKKYWISTNGGSAYADNGLNTSYTFSILPDVRLPYRQRVYVKAMNNADVNTAAASFDITFESASGSPGSCGNNVCESFERARTCPRDCRAVCGDRACTHTENNETCPVDCAVGCGNRICEVAESVVNCPRDCVFSSAVVSERVVDVVQVSQSSSEGLESMLVQAGILDLESVDLALSMISIKRVMVIQVVQRGSELIEQTKVVLWVSNLTNSPLKEIKVLERVPQSVSSVADIRSDFPFESYSGLNAMLFSVPGLFSNETTYIEYVLENEVLPPEASGFGSPVALSVLAATESEVAGSQCQSDSGCIRTSLCVLNRCIRGSCYAVPFPEGEACDVGSVCRSGACVPITKPYGTPVSVNWMVAVGLGILAGMLVLIVWEYARK